MANLSQTEKENIEKLKSIKKSEVEMEPEVKLG